MTLEQGHLTAQLNQLPCSAQAAGARADDGNLRRISRRLTQRLGAASCPLVVGDGALVVADGGCSLDGSKVAGSLAKRWAHTAGEFGERVGKRQALCRLVPKAAVHQVVPLGNQVVQRAARRTCLTERIASLAERHTAHHAAAGLDLLLLIGQRNGELIEVLHGIGRAALAVSNAIMLEVCSCLTHYLTPLPTISYARSSASSWLLPSALAWATI